MLILFRLLGSLGLLCFGLLGLDRVRELVRGTFVGVEPGPRSRQGSHPDSRGEDVRPRQRQDGTTQHDEGDSREAGNRTLHALDLALESVLGHRDGLPAEKSARGGSGGQHGPIAHFLFISLLFLLFLFFSFFFNYES